MAKLWRIALISSGICATLLTTGWKQTSSVFAESSIAPRQRFLFVNRLLRRMTVRSLLRAATTRDGSITDLSHWKRQHPGHTLHFAISGQRSLATGKTLAPGAANPVLVMITEQVGAVRIRRSAVVASRLAVRKYTASAALHQVQAQSSAPEGRQTAAKRVQSPPSPGLRIAALAMSLLGKPYVWGGASPSSGFDCSGLVQYVLEQSGINAPRTTWQQYTFGAGVRRQELQPGDLLFFTTYASGPTHVGVYVGNSQFVSALNSTTGVVLSNLHDPYFASRYLGARCPWLTVATATAPDS
ncbi:MAG: C40 family peptidase [Bacilli bacterium]